MGGGDLTVTSTTDAMVFSNIRFEIGGYSNLYFDVPDLTMMGISSSVRGMPRYAEIHHSYTATLY